MSLSRPATFPLLKLPFLCIECVIKNWGDIFDTRTDFGFESYTNGNEVTALKMALEFLNDVFKCSVEQVDIKDSDFPESFGVKSTGNFFVHYENSLFGLAQNQKLMVLLENLEVTGECIFWVKNAQTDFFCDPKLFKCRKLVFRIYLDSWLTRGLLLQCEVPQLKFLGSPISVEDIAAFVTRWFHSDNKKLEHLYTSYQFSEFSLENFQTAELNPVPFSERNRVPLTESFTGIDFSKGLEIVRHDGLVATIHAKRETFLLYIWHNQ